MSVKKFLDEVGLGHTWSKIKTLLGDKADKDLNNVTNDDFRNKAIDAGVGGLQTVTATSTDGVTYTAEVAGVTELTTGLTITIIPNMTSTSISAQLNVNSLGAKYIRQSTTNNTATGLTPKNAGWMAANKPITIQYDGTQWKTIAARSNASDLNGTVAIANGGTGATSASAALTNLGINDAIVGLSVSGKTITYTQADGGTGTITTQDTSNMTGASSSAAGKAGLVPAPAAGEQASFLRGDGTWAAPSGKSFVYVELSTSFMASCDCIAVFDHSGKENYQYVYVNGTSWDVTSHHTGNMIITLPLKAGDVVTTSNIEKVWAMELR